MKRGCKKIKLMVCFALCINILLSFSAKAEISLFDEVKLRLIQFYKDGVPIEALSADTVEEMIEAIGDKYTVYFTDEEYQKFIDDINRRSYGIGVYIKENPLGLYVSKPIKGAGAEKAGILSGDIIIKADDKVLEGLSLEESAKYVKGQKGTSVRITVKRKNEELTFNIVRQELDLPTVEVEWLNKGKTAHIIISSFGEDTPVEFSQMIKECQVKGVDNYIIDLRYNGGGYMDSALKMLGVFLGDKEVLITNTSKEKDVVYDAYESDVRISKPCIFLINEYSASASEIMAAALKDYDKALFIGETTYGKGVAQSMIPISNGGALKVTSKEFFSPSKKKIHGIGIKPHIEVSGVNPLLIAEEIFEDMKDDSAEFFEITKHKEDKLVNNIEFEDFKSNGWEAKISKLGKPVIIKKNKSIKIRFNEAVQKDRENILSNIELLNGKNGEKIKIDIDIKDNVIEVRALDEIKLDENYILVIRGGMKSNKDENLLEGKIVIIDFEK